MTWLLSVHIRLITLLIPLLDHHLTPVQMARLFSRGRAWKPYRRISPEVVVRQVQQALRRPRWMKRRSCYRLGLTTCHFLGLAGTAPHLHFAIAPPSLDSRRLHGHCWVTLGDQTMTAPPEESVQMRRFMKCRRDRNNRFLVERSPAAVAKSHNHNPPRRPGYGKAASALPQSEP